jgi:colanic acid/amylovoran biosynthesis glycosyltransferase
MIDTVAHMNSSYLGIPRTFIYAYITSMRRYRPIVLTQETLNLELFPFSPIYSLDAQPRLLRVLHRIVFNSTRYPLYYALVFRKEHPCLIHAHFGPQGVLSLPLARQFRTPIITTFYGVDLSLPSRSRIWHALYRRLFSRGDLFLVEGNSMRQKLAQLGCPPEKIRLLRIGVFTAKFQFRPRRLASPSGRIRLLVCGRFVEKKGIQYGIEAFARAKAAHPNMTLRIIGDGPLREDIKAQIGKLGLSDSVTLLGYVPHDEFASELQEANILLAPSVTSSDGDTEGGAPTVLLEAQACGVPVLSTTHADIPEVVLDKKAGILVPERDVNALTNGLLQLIEHPETWLQMGEAGRKHVERHHDAQKVTRRLEQFYDELLNGHTGR